MILGIDTLSQHDFSLSQIRVIHQASPFRQLQVRGRKLNGFVCLLQGKCRFTFDGDSFELEPGAIAYLPYGSRHTFDILTDDTEFYRLDFHLTVGSEVVLFSETPLALCRTAPKECWDAIHQLATAYECVQDSLAKTELMCRIFRSLAASGAYGKKRLAPAITYISHHLTDQIYCKDLAKLCNLSTAQFYEVFKAEYATTPLAYRNQMLLQRACLLLKDASLTVSEIADSLGFESVAYFSRFFKKHKHISPSQYARRNM